MDTKWALKSAQIRPKPLFCVRAFCADAPEAELEPERAPKGTPKGAKGPKRVSPTVQNLTENGICFGLVGLFELMWGLCLLGRFGFGICFWEGARWVLETRLAPTSFFLRG